MAKTLIGQLILRLRTEGLGEANKVKQALSDVNDAARRLGSQGVGTWGLGFQKQIDKLKLTSQEIEQVQKSWVQLHESMKSRNLASALRSSEVGHWKTNTISALAQARSEMDRHFQEAEKAAKRHAGRMQDILKPALVALGAYTVPYLTGILGTEALSASSERRREIFRQRMAGIPQGEQDKLYGKSEALGAQYPSIPITGIMELSRGAYSVMGDAERAGGILQRMVESLVVMQSARGPGAAAQQLIGLVRGLDNLGVNKDGQVGIDQVNQMIDAATRAAQVDPDFDPEKFFQFARATKTAGPALSMDFLTRAPVYIQDMGDGATGNSLAMAFKAFALEAVGSAGGKKYLAERDRLGIRKNGKLVDGDMFGSNPDEWVLKYLVPALQKDGVDLNNDTSVAAAVGKLSGNTTATGFLTRIITQREQVERWLKMMDQAIGTDAAKDVRAEDPFVGWESFKKALENLSSALIPIDHINAGINGLADGINKLASAAEESPLLTALGMGAAGGAAYKGGKFALGAISDMFGLKSSAAALDGSAVALTRAAAALGGAAVVDGGPGSPNKGKGPSWLLAGSVWAAAAGGLWSLLDPGGKYKDAPNLKWGPDDLIRYLLGTDGSPQSRTEGTPASVTSGMALDEAKRARAAGMPASTATLPGKMADDLDVGLASLRDKTRSVGQEMESNLSVTAKPDVDTSAIDAAIAKARTLLGLLSNVAAASAAADRNVNAEMRRNFADSGGSW